MGEGRDRDRDRVGERGRGVSGRGRGGTGGGGRVIVNEARQAVTSSAGNFRPEVCNCRT